jgi:2-polyprenyl-3-methyl-5-hydroxy-6-metoxy-1,4-benzoquinol methylase
MGISEYSEKRYAEHPGFSDAEMEKIDIALRMIGRGKSVLDVGSFDGTISKKISAQGNTVFSADVAFSALQLAKKQVDKLVQIPFEPPYPFFDKTFDVVFAGEVIEHVLDTDGFLQELKRILKDDGAIIITTPNVVSLGRRIMFLLGISPYLEVSLNPKMTNPGIGHIRYFTQATLRELLEINDLEVVECKGDAVNLAPGGKGCSRLLARIFPALSKSLIVKCRKKQ